jgi:DNA mismatch repair protein MutL
LKAVSLYPKNGGTAERDFICGQNLFFIPARRNFLKSDTVEYRHIIDEFQRVALAHPNIYFTFFHNGSEINLPPSSMRQRIVNFSGKPKSWFRCKKRQRSLRFMVCTEFAKKNRGEQFSLSMIDL